MELVGLKQSVLFTISHRVGNSKSPQKGMPKEKQFLLTKNGDFLQSVCCSNHFVVPCLMRVSAFETKNSSSETSEVDVDGESWVATHTNGEYMHTM